MTVNAAAQVDARVVDTALIASFMNAEPPKVWRVDMAKLNTATLELRNDASLYRLFMISPSGEEEVALFKSREDGTAALQSVMNAMLGGAAPVQAVPAQAAVTAAAPVKGGFFKTLFKVILWMIAIVVAIVILSGLFIGDKTAQMFSAIATQDTQVMREGAPVSADDFFK